jgi:hypothetical protein
MHHSEENFLTCCGAPLEFGVCCVCVRAHVTVIILFLPRDFLAFHSKRYQQGSILSCLNFPSFLAVAELKFSPLYSSKKRNRNLERDLENVSCK